MLFTVSGDDKRTTSGKREPGEHSNATTGVEAARAPLSFYSCSQRDKFS